MGEWAWLGSEGAGYYCGTQASVQGKASWTSTGLVSQAKQISPELSALAVYCCASRLRTLRLPPALPQPCQVSSLSERKAKKLIREAGRSRDIGYLGAGGQWKPAGSCVLKSVWKGD